MIEPAVAVAGVLLAAMIVYVATGGADFGGGIWELFARGPRRAQQVAALRHAIAPIWEANHVWLILVVVLLFVCFPVAFAAIMIALYVPVSLLLAGIALRGAAFVFQAYSAGDRRVARASVRTFRIASAVTPLLLGTIVGAVAGGGIRVDAATGTVLATGDGVWLRPFPLLVGAMTWMLCVHLAAVYMTLETHGSLREDFRRRALLSAVGVGAVALPAALVALADAPLLGEPLLRASWAPPLHAGTALLAVATMVALWRRRFALARVTAIAQTAAIVIGWGLAQFPYVVAPDLDVLATAAPPAVLRATLWVLGCGSLLLVPAFVWLFRVFKSR
jgi:cytochrome bd ubiquinol oxidase subunit II